MVKEIRVVTLNCWGLWYISIHREKRIGHLGDELARGRYDIVTLQEVWMEKDYQSICDKAKDVLPYHHYFHSGFLGSGLCILSKWPIVDSLYHSYSLNGYAYRILQGDWFGGKGVGMCVVDVEDFTVNVYTTHNHALYAPSHVFSEDEHFTHRLLQSYELSKFVRLTGNNGDLNLVTGDFNTEDFSLGFKVAKVNADLKDAWSERPNNCKDEPCCTVEAPDNYYTNVKANFYVDHQGMRIDYIMYGTKPICHTSCLGSRLTFQKIPGTDINYSDHDGVEALFKLQKVKDEEVKETSDDIESRHSILQEILPYLDDSIKKTQRQRVTYLMTSLLLGLLLASLWLSGTFQWCTSVIARCGSLVVLLVLLVLIVGGISIGGSVKTTELNQLFGRKRDVLLDVRSLKLRLAKK